VTGAIVLSFLAYRRKKRRQMVIQEAQKQQAIQALRSVQAQLNPHFIFNALTSIQGLVNRGDTDGANKYLSAFSVLMRNTLTAHEQLMGSLHQEFRAMDTYLSLERLRFHFRFQLDIADGLDNLEIPRLLLQPIVENAVKHGVSSLRDQGFILLKATRNETDLLISIEDNGPGFTHAATGQGYGLRLTSDRIQLLNQLYPSTPITLTHTGGVQGTTLTFIFSKWLA
jgi:LytS/YehU family sensor histidine kinase